MGWGGARGPRIAHPGRMQQVKCFTGQMQAGPWDRRLCRDGRGDGAGAEGESFTRLSHLIDTEVPKLPHSWLTGGIREVEGGCKGGVNVAVFLGARMRSGGVKEAEFLGEGGVKEV